MENLATTNIILGIIAAVAVLEGVGIIVLTAVLALLVSRAGGMLRRLEEQQLAPAVGRVNAILDDVKQMSSTVKEDAGRLHALSTWVADFVQYRRT